MHIETIRPHPWSICYVLYMGDRNDSFATRRQAFDVRVAAQVLFTFRNPNEDKKA
jgi:hypothetical protein